jgi:hypothetical protein
MGSPGILQAPLTAPRRSRVENAAQTFKPLSEVAGNDRIGAAAAGTANCLGNVWCEKGAMGPAIAAGGAKMRSATSVTAVLFIMIGSLCI